jgi:hypothetical protein
MEGAGLGALAPAARRRVALTVAGRLDQHGVQAELHNWGGVLCGRAVHDGCCAEVEGRRVQRFAAAADGVQRLVELCCHYTGDKPVEGFRSELRSEGFFGPSAKVEKTFQELSAAWAGLEAEFGADKLSSTFTKTSYAAWLAFRDRWRAGDADTTALSAMVADVNVTRQNLGRARADIRPPDVTETTAALKTAARVDTVAREATTVAKDTWRSVPWSVKAGAAVAGALAALLALLRVTR